MQIVSSGDNLHEISKPIFWKKSENIIDLSSAELALRVVKVKKCYNNLPKKALCVKTD